MLHVDLSDATVEKLGEAVLWVLESAGAVFEGEEVRRALTSVGAHLDPTTGVTKFPRAFLSSFMETVRREHASANPAAASRFQRPGLPGIGCQVAQFVYDFDHQETRPGTRDDLIEYVKLGDVLHGETGVGHCLMLHEVPSVVEPMEVALVLAEYAHKPYAAFSWDPRQEPYLTEMGEIMGLENWFEPGALCHAHPLRFHRKWADRFVPLVRSRDAAASLVAMPAAGVSTPVTVEGFIVVSAAEYVACWIAGRALNPTVPLHGSMWAGTPDMKSGHVSISAFDAMFYGIATAQFVQRWCGVEISIGHGDYVAAKKPGLYAAMEKAYKAMTIAAFTGHHPGISNGMLDAGKVLSDVQLMLDREISAAVGIYARSVEASEENVGLTAIAEVLSGERASFMHTDHTARNFRQSLWMPQLLERTGWNGFDDEAQLLARARENAKSLIGQYRKPEGREEQLRAMRVVVEKARRELL